jgi:hypothetical protein
MSAAELIRAGLTDAARSRDGILVSGGGIAQTQQLRKLSGHAGRVRR